MGSGVGGVGSHLPKSSSDASRNRIIPVGGKLRDKPEEDPPGIKLLLNIVIK